jgi:hypothetical protein
MEKRKANEAVAMFPCFSLPDLCARAIKKRGVRNIDTVLW